MVEILQDLIEDHGLGEVVGSSADGCCDPEEVLGRNPDIILIDFLMPGKDGAELVRELKARGCGAKFIMVSQVSSKDMIGKAYDAGIEFFISKPINLIEVKSVIGNVTQQIRNERTVAHLKALFLEELGGAGAGAAGTAAQQERPEKQEKEKEEPEPPASADFGRSVEKILIRLGMAGEKGSGDIVRVCTHLYETRRYMHRENVRDICAELSDAPKSMEQRMRRAVQTGLTNLAHLGIEDFMNDTFTDYSSTLFLFEEVRAEMDYVRGKRAAGGKVSLKKFIESLMMQAERGLESFKDF